MELKNKIKLSISISAGVIILLVVVFELLRDKTYYQCFDLSEIKSYQIDELSFDKEALLGQLRMDSIARHRRTYYTKGAVFSKIPWDSQGVSKGLIITNGLIDNSGIIALTESNEIIFDIPNHPNGFYEIPNDHRIAFLIVKFRSRTNISTSIIIDEISKSRKWMQNKLILLGIYTGIVFFVCIMNWMFYKIVSRSFFKFYVIYLVSVYAAQGVFSGLFKSVIYPNWQWLTHIDYFIVLPLSYVGCIAFISEFIPMYHRNKRLKYLIRFSGMLVIASSIVGLFFNHYLIPVMIELHITIGVILVFIAIYRSKKKYFYEGRHLFFSWSFFLLGIAFFIAGDLGLIKTTVFASMAMTFGSGFEAISMTIIFSHVLTERDALKRIFRSKYSLASFEVEDLRQSNKEIQTELKKTKNQLLITQLDPHFVFNALNSINTVVMKKDYRQARRYLLSFSRFMRSLLYMRENDFIKLEDEIEILEGYVELEENRIGKKVTFEFHYSDQLDVNDVFIPTMILQPLIENSVWHGFTMLHGRNPVLTVDLFQQSEKILEVIVTDNGIGRAAAEAAKDDGLEKKKSYGLEIVNERLSLMLEDYGIDFKQIEYDDVLDENGKVVGTEATLILPIRTEYDIVVARAAEDPEFAKKAKEYLDDHFDFNMKEGPTDYLDKH